MIIATATGFVDVDAALSRESDALDNLAAQAEMMPDSFADIAAALFSAASERAYALSTLHIAAGEIGPDSPGIGHSVQLLANDARMLLQAHLLFKRLAENEDRARFALGIPRLDLRTGATACG
jgi:hypothetical protein